MEYGVFYTGLIRGAAGMLLGGFVYQSSEWLSKWTIKRIGSVILALIEVGSLVLACLIAFHTQQNYDPVVILLFLICLTITFSRNSATKYVQWNFFCWLGKIALPLYCIHSKVYRVITMGFSTGDYYMDMAVCFVVSMLLSTLMDAMCEKWWPVDRIKKALFE